MAKIIDVSQSDGQLIIVGKLLTLPNNTAVVGIPQQGSIRYNGTSQTVEVYVGSAYQSITKGGGSSVVAAIAATGTNQSTAYHISAQTTIFTTVASGTGAILPVSPLNVLYTVVNRGANPLLIYPPSSAKIENLSVNSPATLVVGGTLNFIGTSSTQFYAY